MLRCRWNISVPCGRSSDKSVKIWDAGSRQCVHTFYEHMDQVSTLCLTVPQSATVAAEIKVPSAISVSAIRIPPPPQPQPPKCCQVFSLKSVVAKKRAPLSALLSHDGLQWMQKLRDPLHPPPSPILCLYFSVNSHLCMLVLTVTYVCLLTITCEFRSPWHPPFPHVCLYFSVNKHLCMLVLTITYDAMYVYASVNNRLCMSMLTFNCVCVYICVSNYLCMSICQFTCVHLCLSTITCVCMSLLICVC